MVKSLVDKATNPGIGILQVRPLWLYPVRSRIECRHAKSSDPRVHTYNKSADGVYPFLAVLPGAEYSPTLDALDLLVWICSFMSQRSRVRGA